MQYVVVEEPSGKVRMYEGDFWMQTDWRPEVGAKMPFEVHQDTPDTDLTVIEIFGEGSDVAEFLDLMETLAEKLASPVLEIEFQSILNILMNVGRGSK